MSKLPIVGIVCDRRVMGQHPFQIAGEKYIIAVREGAGAIPVLLPSLEAAIPPQEILDAVHAVQSGRRYLSPKVAGIVADQVTKRSNISPLDRLSKREREILQLTAEGMSAARVGEVLHLSPATVKTHLRSIYDKLGVSERAAAVAVAMRMGLLE